MRDRDFCIKTTMVNAVPILDGLHAKFLDFCSRHGLKPGYHLTNQIMDMFEGRLNKLSRLGNKSHNRFHYLFNETIQ